MKLQTKRRLGLFFLILLIIFSGLVAYPHSTKIDWLDNYLNKLRFNMGLDLRGGVHLVYNADMSGISAGEEGSALSGVQDVIEKRVNPQGTSETIVRPSQEGGNYRLIVELPAVEDVEGVKNRIKDTPLLEFKEQDEPKTELDAEQQEFVEGIMADAEKQREEKKKEAEATLEQVKNGDDFEQLAKEKSEDTGNAPNGGDLGLFGRGEMVEPFEQVAFSDDLQVGEVYPELVSTDFGYHIIKKTGEEGDGDQKKVKASHILFKAQSAAAMDQTREMLTQQLLQPQWKETGLTGKQLKKTQVVFDQQTFGEPQVSLEFDDEGKELFKQITEKNTGKPVAIFLDGEIISAPQVNDVIRDGRAVISGGFTLPDAKELSQRLNAGALPVPITLVSQQNIEASLGMDSLTKSLRAGFWGLVIVSAFLILYYRLAGLVAVVALVIYVAMLVTIIKVSSLTGTFAITLTLSGIAGLILSMGMAVDANILIFERMKEEIKRGRDLKSATREGYRRAWPSIKDGNVSTIITAAILVFWGTGFIKGFAIVLILGVLLSMFTAIVITRIILNAITVDWLEKHKGILLVKGPKTKK
ncbi:MAG TPA: protein translocase subunit SecD [Candidatus Moranbacteria bacterium]|nr:protein translocase subunit SecD [Candidatus Moranbacteria bacterium]